MSTSPCEVPQPSKTEPLPGDTGAYGDIPCSTTKQLLPLYIAVFLLGPRPFFGATGSVFPGFYNVAVSVSEMALS